MHYLFAAKPTDHKYMMEWLNTYDALHQHEFVDEKKRRHVYEWMNDIPLHGRKEAIRVNYCRCTIIGENKKGEEEIVFRNSWVTDIVISLKNITILVHAGRCRWKSENECFIT
jgi:hypothetical protein